MRTGRLARGAALVLAWLAAGCAAAAPPSPSHEAAIRELIAVTGSLESERAREDEVIASMRSSAPDLPEEVWTRYAARLRDREALLAVHVPVYAAHLAEADVRELLAFYATPLGRHWLEVQPLIQAASRARAEALAARVFGTLDSPSATEPGAAPAESGAAAADAVAVAPSHAAALDELLDATQVVPVAQATMRRLLARIRALPFAGTIGEEDWRAVEQQLTDPAALRVIWLPAYAEHLSELEARELAAFYRTPAGARIAAALPDLQADLIVASERYGAQAARRAIREVLGPLPQWRPPAAGDRAPARTGEPAPR